MKDRHYQRGSAVEITIIVVLVVAVIGALGFIFWNNFVNKPVNNVVDKDKSSKTTSDASIAPRLTIESWNIGGDYTDKSVQLIYKTANEFGNDVVNFSDVRLNGVDSGCDDESVAGYMVRLTGDQEAIQGSTKTNITAKEAYDKYGKNSDSSPISNVGEYYYLYTGPQAPCTSNATLAQIQENASKAAVEFVKTLREL